MSREVLAREAINHAFKALKKRHLIEEGAHAPAYIALSRPIISQNQWKERGVGNVKLLKHKVNGKVRLVMRQSKTLKICANHFVIPTMTVQEHSGNDKSCVWHAADFADGNLKEEMFCIRFPSVENCKTFMETVQEVAESQGKKEENKDATVTADLLDKLSVGEIKSDGKEDTVVASNTKEAVKDEAKTEEDKKDEAASKA